MIGVNPDDIYFDKADIELGFSNKVLAIKKFKADGTMLFDAKGDITIMDDTTKVSLKTKSVFTKGLLGGVSSLPIHLVGSVKKYVQNKKELSFGERGIVISYDYDTTLNTEGRDIMGVITKDIPNKFWEKMGELVKVPGLGGILGGLNNLNPFKKKDKNDDGKKKKDGGILNGINNGLNNFFKRDKKKKDKPKKKGDDNDPGNLLDDL